MLLAETGVVGSDDWWVMQLAEEYGAGLPRLGRLKSYLDGTNVLPEEGDRRMREAYRRFLRTTRLTMADLVVSARTDRMKPKGFYTAAPDDDLGDAAAMANWRRSHMGTKVRDFLTDAGTYGRAYLLVTGPTVPSPDATPYILPSNGWTTVARPYATTTWLNEAAAMFGWDAANQADTITLFRPGYMRVAFRSARSSSIPTSGTGWFPGRGWEWAGDPIPLGYTDEVPVYTCEGPGGMGMFEKHLDSLDRVNQTIRDRLVITAMQAFHQRAIEGKLPDRYPAEHPQAGQKIDYDEVFKAGPASTWILGENTKMWESAASDIRPLLEAVRNDIIQLAATSKTPMYMLAPDSANQTANGADKAIESFIYSVEDWKDRAEDAFQHALATTFRAQGDLVRADPTRIRVDWMKVDFSSIQEQATAAQAAKAGGASQRYIQERIFALTPDEIALEQQALSDQAFNQPATAPV